MKKTIKLFLQGLFYIGCFLALLPVLVFLVPVYAVNLCVHWAFSDG